MLGSFINEVVRAGAVQVISVRAHRQSPAFSYTIGRYRNYGEPELFIVGIPGPRAGIAMQELAERMDEAPAEEAWTLGESGLRVRTKAIPRKRLDKHMLLAKSHYGHSDFPALEVVVEKDLWQAA